MSKGSVMERVIARISPSPGRRWISIGMLIVPGILMLWVAFATPPAELLLQLVLIVFGIAAIWMAEVQRRQGDLSLELTATELRDSAGRLVARLDQIERIDAGKFAFKPSNGFLLVLRSADAGRAWAPGLWWRLGRRVGVGGTAAPAETKAVADLISAHLAGVQLDEE